MPGYCTLACLLDVVGFGAVVCFGAVCFGVVVCFGAVGSLGRVAFSIKRGSSGQSLPCMHVCFTLDLGLT